MSTEATQTATSADVEAGNDHGIPPSAAPRPHQTRLHRSTPVLATIGVLVALFGLAWGTRPLETPTQDCGTAFSFLLDGRVDQFVDPSNPPEGISPEAAQANNDRPCQERAAGHSRPAAALLVGGTLVAAVAGAVDLGVRGVRRYRRVHRPSAHPRLPL